MPHGLIKILHPQKPAFQKIINISDMLSSARINGKAELRLVFYIISVIQTRTNILSSTIFISVSHKVKAMR